MANHGPKARKKIEETAEEHKRGELKNSSGEKVISRDQAVAIGISKAREAGYKLPPEKWRPE